MALTAAATMAEVEDAVAAEEARQGPSHVADESVAGTSVTADPASSIDYDLLADSMVAAMARAEDRKAEEAERLADLRDLAAQFDV